MSFTNINWWNRKSSIYIFNLLNWLQSAQKVNTRKFKIKFSVNLTMKKNHEISVWLNSWHTIKQFFYIILLSFFSWQVYLKEYETISFYD